jgi:hypothetical protein
MGAVGRVGGMSLAIVSAAVTFPAAAAPVKEVYTSADVYAQGTAASSPTHVDPDRSEGSARLANIPGENVPPNYFADARAIADFGGPFRASASIGGTATEPAPNKRFEAESNASQLNDYRVESDTLTPGSPVRGTLTLHYGGTMSLTHPAEATFGPRAFLAEVDTFVQLIETGKSYEGGATLDGDGTSFDYGDFEGDFQFTNDGAGHQTATLDLTESVTFDTTVGATFQFQFDLVTHAYAAELNRMPAESNFFDTAT